jgi:threonylcarbamoyladenosine tRNA methylthiotransferase MtaB
MSTIKFYTLGCKVNQYETQSMREQFIRAGFKELDNHKPADIYLINTCTVTQRADSESLNFMRRAKRENPKAKILVTGCLTELDEDKIKKVDSEAVIVKKGLSPPELNSSQLKGTVPKINGITYFKGHTRAFLKIQDGCNNFCSYCKVPLVRGTSKSKPLDEITQEADKLVKNDFKEIVLTGICLGAYGGDLNQKRSLVEVIKELEKIEGLFRIRLSSIEAGDISEELINTLVQSKKLCRHLHIPIQSGDDEILKKMKRKYCRDDYLNLIKKIKSRIPQVAITTDVLVGFPGETEANFQNTVELIKEILPLKVHIFPYSRRLGTPAASHFADEISPDILGERIARLKNIAETCAFVYEEQFLHKSLTVLIEGEVKNKFNFWQGYTDNYIKILIKSNLNLKNQLLPLKLEKIIGTYVLAEGC